MDPKFGDMVTNTIGSGDNPMMVIAMWDECPAHFPPCLVLSHVAYRNPERLSGWCYDPSGWEKIDDPS